MTLYGILGLLGDGKTTALTYLAWRNWQHRGRRIFSNMTFYGFPFTKINSIPSIDNMKDGFFAGDELWLWIDSYSRIAKNKLISDIILKSRKRNITICFTSQDIKQITSRVRRIVDISAVPTFSPNKKHLKITNYHGVTGHPSTDMRKPFYSSTMFLFAAFDTNEEIQPILHENNKESFKEFYYPVKSNATFTNYLKKSLKITAQAEINNICKEMEKIINPQGFKSEAARKGKIKEDFNPL